MSGLKLSELLKKNKAVEETQAATVSPSGVQPAVAGVVDDSPSAAPSSATTPATPIKMGQKDGL